MHKERNNFKSRQTQKFSQNSVSHSNIFLYFFVLVNFIRPNDAPGEISNHLQQSWSQLRYSFLFFKLQAKYQLGSIAEFPEVPIKYILYYVFYDPKMCLRKNQKNPSSSRSVNNFLVTLAQNLKIR